MIVVKKEEIFFVVIDVLLHFISNAGKKILSFWYVMNQKNVSEKFYNNTMKWMHCNCIVRLRVLTSWKVSFDNWQCTF